MHVTRKTNTELALVDSSIWVSMFLLCVAVPIVYASMSHRKPNWLWAAGFFMLFAFLFWRKEVVVFDAARQQAAWRRRRAFKAASGMVPFGEIKGIGMESSSGGNNVLVNRLTILTSGQPVPMSDVFAAGRKHYEGLRTEILEFLHLPDAGAEVPGSGQRSSIESLLMQGRKIDAVELLRSSEKIGLSEAVNRVNKLEKEMKAAK
ncbi:MAG: hypothetical protein WBQ95_13030 [Terracidiphilus sp.]